MTSSTDEVKELASPFWTAWAKHVVRLRWLLLALTFLVTGIFADQGKRNTTVDMSIEAFLSSESEAARVLEDLRDDFGRDQLFLVLCKGEEVFDLAFLERLRGLHDELDGLDLDLKSLGQRRWIAQDRAQSPAAADASPADGFDAFGEAEGWGDERGGSIVDEVISLVNARHASWQNDSLRVGGLLDEWPSRAELPALRTRVLADRSLVGRVVDAKGKHAMLLVRTDFMSDEDAGRVYAALKAIGDKHQQDGFEVHIAGTPAIAAVMHELTFAELRKLGLAGLLMVVIFMGLLFRHPVGAIGPALVALLSVVWATGTMAATGTSVTLLTSILPLFVIVVGTMDSVHLQSEFVAARRSGLNKKQAAIAAVGLTGTPIFYTSLTTILGMLSLHAASADAIGSLGLFAAVGVLVSMLHSLVLLPIVLTIVGGVRVWADDVSARRDLLSRFLDGAYEVSRRRGAIGIVAAVSTAFAVLGVLQLEVEHDPLTWLPPQTGVRVAVEEIDEHLGGALDVTVLVDSQDGETLRSKEVMDRLEALQSHIEQFDLSLYEPNHGIDGPIVSNVNSLVDVVKETSQAVNQDQAAFYRIPDSDQGTKDMLTLFESASPEHARRLATVDFERSLMTVRVKWMDATLYMPLVSHIREGVQTLIGDAAQVKLTGATLNLVSIVSGLLTDLARSFGLALLVVTLVVIFMIRDLRLGLLSIIPNLLPVLLVIGAMGWIGLGLDVNNMLLASIATGVVVDDTIHFLHRFKVHHSAHGDVEAAIRHVFAHSGRAVVITSLMLACGFGVFLLAELATVYRLGLLMMATVLLALLADLAIIPVLLRVVYGTPVGGKQPSTKEAVPCG